MPNLESAPTKKVVIFSFNTKSVFLLTCVIFFLHSRCCEVFAIIFFPIFVGEELTVFRLKRGEYIFKK